MNVELERGRIAMITLITKANGTRCDRCWRYTEDVGQNKNYPTVCLRCAEALTEIGFAPYTKETESL